jgi:hypothetical protein
MDTIVASTKACLREIEKENGKPILLTSSCFVSVNEALSSDEAFKSPKPKKEISFF